MSEPQALGGSVSSSWTTTTTHREIIERTLTRRGRRWWRAPSAPAALLLFAEQRFDVLLVDIMMPGMDGYAFMRKIRALPSDEGGRVPAATLTARAVTDDRLESLRAGFQSHLKKPVDADELAHVVATLAGRGTA
jgi:CheY-like chemotaxis protein